MAGMFCRKAEKMTEEKHPSVIFALRSIWFMDLSGKLFNNL